MTTKQQVINMLGNGNASEAARAIGITRQSFNAWPDRGQLPPRLEDRYIAAMYRKQNGIPNPAPRRRARSTEAT